MDLHLQSMGWSELCQNIPSKQLFANNNGQKSSGRAECSTGQCSDREPGQGGTWHSTDDARSKSQHGTDHKPKHAIFRPCSR